MGEKIKISKQNIIISVIICCITIVFVATMFIQFKTVEETNVTQIESMRADELRTEISNWKTKYNEISEKLNENLEKINEYNNKINNNQEASELLTSELDETNKLLGLTNVQGEGTIVTLTDNADVSITASDLVELVNELRYAGAEAISINGTRIINMSDIVDINNKYILANGERIVSPYIVKAIGNKTYLSSTLALKTSGYIDKYTNNGKTVKLETSDNIQIEAYNQVLTTNYIKGE